MNIIYAEKYKPINLGRFDENNHTIVKIPLDDVKEEGARYGLVHQRFGDEHSYPCANISVNGEYLDWVINEVDVAIVGKGRAEIFSYFGEDEQGRAKSFIYTTKVTESMAEGTDVPPPYQTWVDSVLKEFAFSHKLENIACNYISIPHSAEPHCDSEETETGLILTFYIPMGEQGIKGDKGDKGDRGEQEQEDYKGVCG